jgi:hypothetical protein
MSVNATIEPMFLSASQVSRRIDVPIMRLLKAVHDGRVRPDSIVSPNMFLFQADRLPTIKALITKGK